MSARWEQLLYTSVDHVVNGRASSGWQVKERSDGMDDALAQDLVSLVQPQLAPIESLPGFPTQEQVDSADRRLVRRVLHGMPVLLHTALAGQDTTGRPNTVTHVLVDRATEVSRPLLGAEAWRAAWWSTPYGADAVRGAALAPSAEIAPGGVVTFDSAAALIKRWTAADVNDGGTGRAARVLSALADAVSSGEGIGDGEARPLAVLVIDQADEALQWIGALERTCAPAAARWVQWSSLERVANERDLEALRSQGLSVVGVPRADIEGLGRVPRGCVVIDPHEATGPAKPRSAWGRFVHAMAMSRHLWITAMDALSIVEGALTDPRGVTLAWSAAMAQIVSPGLLDEAFDGDARAAAAAVVTSTPVAGAGTGVLRRYLDEVVGDVESASTGTWFERLASMPEDAPIDGLARMLAERYVHSAVRDRDWLLSSRERAQRPAGPLRRALRAWSTEAASLQSVRSVVETAQHTVDADDGGWTTADGGRPGEGTAAPGAPGRPDRGPSVSVPSASAGQPERRARVLVALSSDGIIVPGDVLGRFLIPIAEGIVQRRTDVDSQTIAILPSEVREQLRVRVDDLLADQDRDVTGDSLDAGRFDEPHLVAVQMRALVAGAADLHQTPYVGLQSTLTELIAQHARLQGRGASTDTAVQELARACVGMLEGISKRRTDCPPSAEGRAQATTTLTPEAAGAVSAFAPLDALDRLSMLLTRSQAESIADRIALRDIQSRETIAWAQQRSPWHAAMNGGTGRAGAGTGPAAAPARAEQRPSAVARLIQAAALPVLALPEQRRVSGLNQLDAAVKQALHVQRGTAPPVPGLDHQGRAAMRRLLELTRIRWDAASVLMRVSAQAQGARIPVLADAGFVARVPELADSSPQSLVAMPDAGLFPGIDPHAPLGQIPIEALRALVELSGSPSGSRSNASGRSSSRTGRLDPALRDAAIVVLRVYAGQLGEAMEPVLREQLSRTFAVDPNAMKQAESILEIGGSADGGGEKGMAGAVAWTRSLLKRKEERNG